MHRIALATLLLIAWPVLAQQAYNETTYARANIPKEISAAANCDTDPESIMGERFGEGWLWSWPCPSNHANQIRSFIYSRDKIGRDAKRIRFPTPHKGKLAWLDDLSNVEVFPNAREFYHYFTDPENQKVCRTDAVWIARDPLKPQLVFWREARSCEGDKDWRVLTDKFYKGKKK
jgi:hypothetical protein